MVEGTATIREWGQKNGKSVELAAHFLKGTAKGLGRRLGRVSDKEWKSHLLVTTKDCSDVTITCLQNEKLIL